MATLTKRVINLGTFTDAATPLCVIADSNALDTPTVTGDQFIANDRTFLEMASSTTLSVRVIAQKPNEDGIYMHVQVAMAQNLRKKMGPFDSHYVDSNGYVQITYPAGITGLTIAAYELASQGF
jgi:hypothetical protein